MISTALAAALRDAGLVWAPISGDAFQIAGPDFEGDVFHVSDMTVEAHVYSTGTVLGFNGTTEWALDSVALDDALWLPREDQLRDLLRDTFVSLEREPHSTSTAYVVTTRWGEQTHRDAHDDAVEAYGRALLRLLEAAG
ncbi:pilus assembly protein CpaE [Pseudolysinimonas sp.]